MKKFSIILLAVSSLAACAPMDSVELNSNNTTAVKKFTPMVFTSANSTKLSIGTEGNGVTFFWDQGDAIGIFAVSSNCSAKNVEASISEGIGSNMGVFMTNARIDLTEGEDNNLLVYYPRTNYANYSAEANTISGLTLAAEQIQSAANNSEHLGKYDFGYDMNVISTSVDAPVTFTLNHAVTTLRINFTTEKYLDYSVKSVTLTTDEGEALAAHKYSAELISNTESNIYVTNGASNSVKVTLTNATPLTENGKMYMTVLPADLTGKTFKYTVELVKEGATKVVLEGERQAGGAALLRSKIYSLNLKLDTFTELAYNGNGNGNGNFNGNGNTDGGNQ